MGARRSRSGLAQRSIPFRPTRNPVCISASPPPTRKGVDAFHAAALQAGGRDNGAPGLRADYGPDYYAAFVIDPDGYRLEAHCG